jgi:quercetin dioxygenase-like cupin family protein
MIMKARDRVAIAFCSSALLIVADRALSQPIDGGVCRPVSERKADVGCWILVNDDIGALPGAQTFWHLDVYPTRVAALAAKGVRGTVVEALGKVWLLSIEGAGWRPVGGQHIAEIGPIPIRAGDAYSAQYMEAVFTPGMTAPAHRHGGPEIWYTESGETCLETPTGKVVGRAGGPPVIIPEGPPMYLTATGTAVRRALVLILHSSSKPATTMAPDWTPKGLCKQ